MGAVAAALPSSEAPADASVSKTDAPSTASRSPRPTVKESKSPKTVQAPKSKALTKIDKLVASLETKKVTLQDKLQAAHAKNASGPAVTGSQSSEAPPASTRLNKQILALNKKIAQT